MLHGSFDVVVDGGRSRQPVRAALVDPTSRLRCQVVPVPADAVVFQGAAPIAPARLYSFTDAEENTKEQIQKARSHPWISPEVPVRGFVYDVHTGRLSEVFPDRETVTG